MSFEDGISLVGKAVEIVGVAIIVVGIVRATLQYVRRYREETTPPAYTLYRRSLGRAVLLGLEFLVAADIIHTVGTELTFRGLGALAILILIRTFLSVEIEMEIEGRWPWQAAREGATNGEG